MFSKPSNVLSGADDVKFEIFTKLLIIVGHIKVSLIAGFTRN